MCVVCACKKALHCAPLEGSHYEGEYCKEQTHRAGDNNRYVDNSISRFFIFYPVTRGCATPTAGETMKVDRTV